jgi:hypothetical protein
MDEKQAGPRRRKVEVYQEENFEGADLTRTVHIGWGVTLGEKGQDSVRAISCIRIMVLGPFPRTLLLVSSVGCRQPLFFVRMQERP